MALPLPRVVPDVGPGGGLVTALNGMNALQEAMLKNKYYGPNIESEINNRNAFTEGQKINNQYLPDKLKLANALSQLRNQFYGPNIQSEINNRNALTQKYNTMTPLEAEELRLKNEFYPELSKSNISARKALSDYRNIGGSGMGVAQKELQGFQQQLSLEHPDLSPQQINQMANSYLNNEKELPDGTPLPPVSGIAKSYVDNIIKRGTTAQLITSGVKANQAEAELEVLNKYANEGLKPYGTTYFNKSPQQILDSFKSDPQSQKRLGKFIGSQALQYEAAQNRIRLANGQPGVSSTEELMRLSGQLIATKYPRLSQQAREEATTYLDEALKKGLEARRSIETGASGIRKTKSSKPTLRYNQQTGDFEEIK